jgi:type I restriction enzyme S subunit
MVTKEAYKDDVLMSVRAPVGPVNFSVEKICIGRGLAAIRPSKSINKDFLFNFLLKLEKEIIGSEGAVFNSISKGQIEEITLPLPTTLEQERIVSVIDKLSTETKKIESIYQQKLTDLEQLQKSILYKAFNGKLTEKELEVKNGQ